MIRFPFSFLSSPLFANRDTRADALAPPDWSVWLRYFRGNTRRPLPLRLRLAPEEAGGLYALPVPTLRALLVCLAVLQKGETGEGRIAYEIDRAILPGIDDDYRAALKLFVAEEGRHARLLAILITGLGGRLLEHTVSGALFTWIRRLMGVRLKLLVLATAEIAGIVLYARFARLFPAGPCRSLLREIVRDEKAHLRFHAVCFHAWLHLHRFAIVRTTNRIAFRCVWRGMTGAACLAMLFTLRGELRDLKISNARIRSGFRTWGRRLEAIACDAYNSKRSVYASCV